MYGRKNEVTCQDTIPQAQAWNRQGVGGEPLSGPVGAAGLAPAAVGRAPAWCWAADSIPTSDWRSLLTGFGTSSQPLPAS